ncbi:hypothetical protein KEM55_002980 [Ascosphaera atra]|nr:hypothetical protein KEM55_002980 [Ascosphaera atra]
MTNLVVVMPPDMDKMDKTSAPAKEAEKAATPSKTNEPNKQQPSKDDGASSAKEPAQDKQSEQSKEKENQEEQPGKETQSNDAEPDSTQQSQDEEQAGADKQLEAQQQQSQTEGEGEEATQSQEPGKPRKLTFLDYLKSPIVELIVGQGDAKTTLTAHRDLLSESPYFREALSGQDASEPVRAQPHAPAHTPNASDQRTPSQQQQHKVELPDESVEAVGCFLQYQYRGEYNASSSSGDDEDNEDDRSPPAPDDAGEQLLRHARVFFLASKFGHDELKRLARHKIHRIESTPRGEIAYARFIYANKSADAWELRRPAANFWAANDHLRDEVREEFRATCLEFPEFSYDILSSEKKRPAPPMGEGEREGRDRQSQAKRRRSRRY